MLTRITQFLLLTLFAAAPLLRAADGKFFIRVDPEASRITVRLGATLHEVNGTFRVLEGGMEVDPGEQTIQGRVTVAPLSGTTGNSARDRKMRSEVLEAEHYPEIAFEFTGYTGTLASEGDSRITIEGDLVLHGARHRLHMPAEVSRSGARIRATAAFPVPYVDWGMRNPSTLLLRVQPRVDVQVTLIGTASVARL